MRFGKLTLTFLTVSYCFVTESRAQLVSHWTFDGDLLDAEGPNDGTFFGGDEPLFVEGYDGTENGAVFFDGVDDYVQIPDDPDSPTLALSERFSTS